jgi:hypothetical protein
MSGCAVKTTRNNYTCVGVVACVARVLLRREKYGNLTDGRPHRCCCVDTGASGPLDVPVVLVDCTRNLQLRACAVSGCTQELRHGEHMDGGHG